MINNQISNTYEYAPASGKVPQSIVLLLHGLGSNGQDLISLAPYFAKALPDTVFVSPDAPFACDMVPPGYPNSYQWFSLQDRDPHIVLQGVEMAAPMLESFITDQLKKYDLPANKLALTGFSQGTMMSLHVGTRYTDENRDKVAGVLGYSGALCGEAGDQNVPIHLIHGEADDVVTIDKYNHARGTLIGKGFTVTGHTTAGLTHSIDEAGIQSGAEFLKSIFA